MAYIGTQPKDIRSFGKAKFDFTATQGQTAFTGADDDGKTLGFTAGQVSVYVNGILMDDSDYTASNGNTITLTSAANASDIISVVALQTDIPNSDYVPATGGTFSGAVVANDGLTVNNDGATVLTVDRATSDGSIVDFKKSGTTVGSIGVSNPYLTIGNGPVGLNFQGANNRILPWNISTNDISDASIDIGNGPYRFKDLYLSGGVYLGGTGAANLLDDYEEGTWTPSITAGGSGSYTAAGEYTKIGNLVIAVFYVEFSSWSGNASNVQISLPFTSLTGVGSAHAGSATIGAYGGVSSYYPLLGGWVPDNTTNLFILGSNGSNDRTIKGVDLSSVFYVYSTVTYRTSA